MVSWPLVFFCCTKMLSVCMATCTSLGEPALLLHPLPCSHSSPEVPWRYQYSASRQLFMYTMCAAWNSLLLFVTRLLLNLLSWVSWPQPEKSSLTHFFLYPSFPFFIDCIPTVIIFQIFEFMFLTLHSLNAGRHDDSLSFGFIPRDTPSTHRPGGPLRVSTCLLNGCFFLIWKGGSWRFFSNLFRCFKTFPWNKKRHSLLSAVLQHRWASWSSAWMTSL